MSVTVFSTNFDHSNNLHVTICCHWEDGCKCQGDTPEHYTFYEKIPEDVSDPSEWVKLKVTRWLADAEARMNARAPINDLVKQLVGLSSDGIDRVL